MGIEHDELVAIVLSGELAYLDFFCNKYGLELIDIQPNTESSPPQGLMYYFNNDLGGYSMEGIKKSLFD